MKKSSGKDIEIVQQEAQKILDSLIYLPPRIMLPAAELAFITILVDAIIPEKINDSLDMFAKHVKAFVKDRVNKDE